MRRLLLIAGEHPPPETIAGITTTRLARHLPAAGWEVEVVRRAGFVKKHQAAPQTSRPQSHKAKTIRRDPFAEWLPFGEAVFDVRQMIREGLALHAANPFSAILVRTSPVADGLVGDAIARRTGLPVIYIHGDPWGPCRQRAPQRPFWTRIIEGRAEAKINQRAAGVILNTDTTRRDYLTAFPFLDPNQVHTLRSPSDCAALSGSEGPVFDTPTVLFPGGFSDFVPPKAIFDLCKAIGAHPELTAVQVALTNDPGPCPYPKSAPIKLIGRHPQSAMLSLMEAADILIGIAQPSDQRIPLKLSDFLCSNRPVLVLEQTSHPELRDFVTRAGYGTVISASAPGEAADWIAQTLKAGRHPVVTRNAGFAEARTAERTAERLAEIINNAVEGRT